ncbi:TIGR02569 family protein [Corynebacterium halotolerans]|uniref:TIGR02569 family protein n=1 Tax=Corynebacterium halotolerans TaxID=225326 RepID=UPI003CF14778
MTENPQLPDFVQSGFHVEPGTPEPAGLAWDHGWRVGTVVFSRALSADAAAWSAKTREKLRVPGLRVARPIRATDGRYVVSGWRASNHIDGQPARRVDEAVHAALRLDDALSALDIPAFAREGGEDPFTKADRASRSGNDCGNELAARLTAQMEPLAAAEQVCHADLLATLLFSGYQAPAVTDLVAVAHPHGYTAALVMVDGLLAGAVDTGVLDRFDHLPGLDQLLLRALCYRVLVHQFHEDAIPTMAADLERVAETLMSRVSATM